MFRPLVDYAVYIKKDYIESFTKEYRQHLLNILLQKVIYDDKVVTLKRSIEMFINNIINYFNNKENVCVPELRSDLYEY